MGDPPAADGSAQVEPLTDKNEITGARQVAKQHRAVEELRAKRKKRGVFSYGRGVFSLDKPFNG